MRHKVTGLPVVVFVAIKANPKDEDFFPICSAETEDGGYFVTGVPIIAQPDYAKLTAAKAHVGQTPIAIRLDFEPVAKVNVLPHRIILVLDSAATSALAPVKEDCGCDELNFLEKRVLDEFTYFTVVRTTEPKIEAMHIDDVAEVDLADLLPPSDPLRGMVGGLTLPPGLLNSYLDRNPADSTRPPQRSSPRSRAHHIRKIVGPPVKKPRGRVILDGTVPGNRLRRDADDLSGDDRGSWSSPPVQAGVVRRWLLDRRSPLFAPARAWTEETDRRLRLGSKGLPRQTRSRPTTRTASTTRSVVIAT